MFKQKENCHLCQLLHLPAPHVGEAGVHGLGAEHQVLDEVDNDNVKKKDTSMKSTSTLSRSSSSQLQPTKPWNFCSRTPHSSSRTHIPSIVVITWAWGMHERTETPWKRPHHRHCDHHNHPQDQHDHQPQVTSCPNLDSLSS